MTLQILENRKPDISGCGPTASRPAANTHGSATGRRRAWIALALFVISLVASPAAAQEDCSFPEDWDDIGWFRRCLQEERWEDDRLKPILRLVVMLSTNPAIVQLLLQAGADPLAVSDDGRTPLHDGARNSNPVVTAHLLAAGADPNALDNEGRTPLHEAARLSGNGRVIARLLAAGADPRAEAKDGRTPLHSALRVAAVSGVISALIQGGGAEELTPLQLAAVQGDSPKVNSLLEEGADPKTEDPYGWNALHFAVPIAGSEAVSTLLEAGADPNAATTGGMTPLHLAVRQPSMAVVSALVEAGGDPNLTDGQARTPLHVAAGQASPAVVSDLLEAGADPNSTDHRALTPLHLAAWQSAVPSVVLALLDGGADPTARDEAGRRPVDFARANEAIIGSSAYQVAAREEVRKPSRPRPASHVLPLRQPWSSNRTSFGSLSSSDGIWENDSYYNRWPFSARAGRRLLATMESDDVDAYLEVVGRDGNTLESDDDSGSGTNARIGFGAPYTGE